MEGERRTDGPWRFAIHTERPRRLGATPNPDGPMTFHGPVTRYRFQGQYLWQDNQGGRGGMLGQDLLEKRRAELEDPAGFYYYSFQTINLMKDYEAGRLVMPSELR